MEENVQSLWARKKGQTNNMPASEKSRYHQEGLGLSALQTISTIKGDINPSIYQVVGELEEDEEMKVAEVLKAGNTAAARECPPLVLQSLSSYCNPNVSCKG